MASPSKQRVRITYTSPGTQPPLFVAGAFTDPPWQPCEMDHVNNAPDSTVDPQGQADNTFFKEFRVAEGSWQYKFRLGPGDWWACDETAEIGWLIILLPVVVVPLTSLVTDDAGNRNNLLVVAPHHAEHAYMEKHLHARPFHRSDESSHDTAWEVVGTDVDSSAGSRQKHSHNKGHFDLHSPREGSEEIFRGVQPTEASGDPLPDGVTDTRRSPCVHPKASREDLIEDKAEKHDTQTPENTLSDGASVAGYGPLLVQSNTGSESLSHAALDSKDQNPALAHSEAGAESPHLLVFDPKDSIDFNVEASIPFVLTDTEAQGDRKMSSVDVEKVKFLMSMTNPNGNSPTIMAVQEGEIVEFDPAEPEYSPSWASPGLERNVHSHAPLLSHECLTCGPEANTSDPQARKQSNSSEDHDSSEDPPTPDDFDSPHLERFPSGAKDILQRIATLQREIPPDDAIVFQDDYLTGSPSFLTREAPTFPHEMPPIGSPAALRRKASSLESPPFPGDMGKSPHLPSRDTSTKTDGSLEDRLHCESPHASYLLPPSSFPLNYSREDSRDSPRRSLASSRSFTDNEEEPLLQAASKPAHTSQSPRAAAPQSSPPSQDSSLAREGARLRNAKTADLISSTEDSSSAASDVANTSWWHAVVNWVSALLAKIFGVRRTE